MPSRNTARAEVEAKAVNPPQPVDVADGDVSPRGDDEPSFDLVALAQPEHLFDPSDCMVGHFPMSTSHHGSYLRC